MGERLVRMTRTQDEVVERLRGINESEEDMFGFRFEVLTAVLDAEHIGKLDDVEGEELPDGWDLLARHQRDHAGKALIEYYQFALGKIEDHRGISAMRSVEKLREHVWLIGRDDVIEAMDREQYPMYGAPMLRRMASMLDLSWPDTEPMRRMADGLPCSDNCGGCRG